MFVLRRGSLEQSVRRTAIAWVPRRLDDAAWVETKIPLTLAAWTAQQQTVGAREFFRAVSCIFHTLRVFRVNGTTREENIDGLEVDVEADAPHVQTRVLPPIAETGVTYVSPAGLDIQFWIELGAN